MKLRFLVLLISFFFFVGITGCSKSESDCYDAAMEEAHSGLCTQDCPGVCGCDGNFYCNACIASSHGISVVEDGGCN